MSRPRNCSDLDADGLLSPLSPGRPPVKDSDLRIAVYSSNFFTEDGVTLTCRRIMAHVKERGGSVRILTTIPPRRAPDSDRTVLDSEVIQVPAMDFPMPSFKRPADSAQLESDGYVVGKMLGQRAMAELLEFNPTIMHITAPDGGALAAISWAYRHNVPVMTTWHSNFHEYVKFYPLPFLTTPIIQFWLGFFYMQTPLILVPTAQLKQELAVKLGLNLRRMSVWGRGINGRTFTPALRSEAFRAAHGADRETVLLCWSSRIVIEKRFDIFVDVIRRLTADGLNVAMLIAGKAVDDLGAGQLRAVQATLPNVSYIGWVRPEELAVAYASSDLLLFPSPVETFGNVTLEAMASGMAVIVDEGTGSHLVEDGVHGYTVRRGDVESYYQAARKLCVPSASPLRKRMGEAGRQRALASYDNEANSQEMVAHYKAIMGRPSSSIRKRSLRWFWIDIFANVVLGLFIGGSFVIKYVLTALFWLIALFQ